MTNFEKYKDEILEIAENDGVLALLRATGEPVNCGHIHCSDCIFCPDNCQSKVLLWMYDEAIEEPPRLTAKERGFCEIIRSGYIARDKNGSITWWNSANGRCEQLNGEAFTFITWESDKAWSVGELLQLEVEE